MANRENENPTEKRPSQDALQLGPRKKPYDPTCHFCTDLNVLLIFALYRRSTDPLVHHGRHFGRAIHALCNVQALINNGIIRMGERSEEPEDAFTPQ